MKSYIQMRIAEERLQVMTTPNEAPWFWLSFVDPSRNPGERFLGVSIVQADDFIDAVEEAWTLGANPGGEVQGVELPDDFVVEASLRNRILSEKELASAGLIGAAQ